MSKRMSCWVCRERFTAQTLKAQFCSQLCSNRWYSRRRYGNGPTIDPATICSTCSTDLQGNAEHSLGMCTGCWSPPPSQKIPHSLLDKLYGGSVDRVWGSVGTSAQSQVV